MKFSLVFFLSFLCLLKNQFDLDCTSCVMCHGAVDGPIAALAFIHRSSIPYILERTEIKNTPIAEKGEIFVKEMKLKVQAENTWHFEKVVDEICRLQPEEEFIIDPWNR
jgi:hypothetical protein